MAATTETTMDETWQQVAADITALTMVQIVGAEGMKGVVEVVANASAPAASAKGIKLDAGDTITSAVLPDIGSSGKLYARGIKFPSYVRVL